jgi:hypothetical protein
VRDVDRRDAEPTLQVADFVAQLDPELRVEVRQRSSISRIFGLMTIARARATRCCCPPDNSCGIRAAWPPSCTRSSDRATRSAISCSGTRRIARPKATLSATLLCGKMA